MGKIVVIGLFALAVLAYSIGAAQEKGWLTSLPAWTAPALGVLLLVGVLVVILTWLSRQMPTAAARINQAIGVLLGLGALVATTVLAVALIPWGDLGLEHRWAALQQGLGLSSIPSAELTGWMTLLAFLAALLLILAIFGWIKFRTAFGTAALAALVAAAVLLSWSDAWRSPVQTAKTKDPCDNVYRPYTLTQDPQVIAGGFNCKMGWDVLEGAVVLVGPGGKESRPITSATPLPDFHGVKWRSAGSSAKVEARFYR